MSSLRKIVVLFFVLLWLAACSDDDGDIVLRFDENGNAYSPTAIEGSIEYLSSMTPEEVRIVTLKYDLSPIDSFEVPVKSSWNDYNFEKDSYDYESPYVKIVTVFPAQGNKKMEFAQYVRLSKSNSNIKLNLHLALMADRIKTLMDKEDYDFEKAQKTALKELEKVFGSDLSDVYERDFKNGVTGDLGDVAPYVYCRHEVSDSVFYGDFKKFRETFAEKGTIDSTWIIKAADTWLSTFEVLVDSMYYLAKSGARDSANRLAYLDSVFIWKAYDVLVKDSVVKIQTKSSDFYGRSLYKEWIGNDRSSMRLWRLVSSLEDSLGLCKHEEKQTILRNDTLYVCGAYSHIWKIVTERDSLFNHQYGECNTYGTLGQLIYVHDSLFTCLCEGNKCTWSDKYVDSVFTKDNIWYESVLDAKAVSKFGPCDQLAAESGEMKPLGDVFVQCFNRKWREIDTLDYYLGFCSRTNYRGEHNGVYYSCQGKWPNIDDTTWHEIYPPEYYNDECELDRIVKYDSSYYICERLECEGDGCFAFRTWRKLEDVELIPPVVNMDTCESPQQNLKLVYDSVFYECKDGKWNAVPEDSLLPPEKDGLVCRDSLFGSVEKYDRDYYRCDTNRVWRVMKPLEALPYEYRDSLGYCDTISNKILHWHEGAFVGCVIRDSAYQWEVISVGTSPYSLPSSINKKKLAGNPLTDSVYTITADGVEYRFNIVKMTYTTNYYNLILEHMTFDGKGYDAYSYNGNLFLHAERGKDSVLLNSIENKSASFDVFYPNWKQRIGGLWACPSTAEVKDEDISVIMYNENAFMNYEKAKAFCPEGYHIPNETEIERKLSIGTGYLYLRNDSPISWSFKGSGIGCSTDYLIYADVFWTSTEKDSDTQYCYETTLRTPTQNVKGNGIVECPKDLYPMVQVLCVKDE